MTSAKAEKADFLIVGSGIAALRAAVDLAAHGRVLILNKGDLFKPATHYSLGGVAVALAEDDEVTLHLHDTLVAGDGLCREEAVRVLVEDGPPLIQELIDWGASFHRAGAQLEFSKAGAHSRSRILRAHGASTGGEMRRVLMAKAQSLDSIRLQPHAFVTDLRVEAGRVVGVTYMDEKNSAFKNLETDSVLLATGGLGQAYKETTNPPFACGDGAAMAWRAGAFLSDMEFIQFHPTVLYMKGAPRFVMSEALCSEGGQLRNIDLQRFMPRYHEAAELAPRDVVSRAMMLEMQKCQSDFHYLDLTSLNAERVKKRFPQIYSRCLEFNIDISADLIPVRPAAHYAMGGVATSLSGATSLPGLYAAGEAASTGVHGANRLVSNSLLEDLVYGARAARAMAEKLSDFRLPKRGAKPAVRSAAAHPASPRSLAAAAANSDTEMEKLTAEIRTLLWENVGIIRQGKCMSKAMARLEEISLNSASESCRKNYEARNILDVARLITRSALAREESRGAHYRSDFPLKSESVPPQHSFISKDAPVILE